LAAALGETSSLGERHDLVSRRLQTAVALEEALRSETEAETAYHSALARLDRLVSDSVFATVRQVRDAIRSEADIASGEALNRAHSTERAATEKILADPTLLQAVASPTPDVVVLGLAAEEAAARATLAAATGNRLEVAAARLDALVAEVTTAVDDWRPLRHRRDRAEHLASMATGTSRDNLTKTKLSHYVLAARLEQVVEAANARLGGICGGRYELEHTLLRGVGDARGGLGLRVLDTYTGARRDPATLSGGETFYVSLALALGLADLVNNEIGGAELSTLFVDEGFGTLDADTLDEVMDELDALRSGGRAVGLVSHLAELRIRVPAQLSVIRSPAGSRLDDSW
jgi:exonuclease SbcC